MDDETNDETNGQPNDRERAKPPERIVVPLLPDVEEVRRFSVAELEAEPPPVLFLWDGRIPHRKATVLAGAGGTGKSSLLVGLAMHRAVRWPFLSATTMEGATLFVSAEDDRDDYRRKIAAWKEAQPLFKARRNIEAIRQNVLVWDRVGEPSRLVTAQRGGFAIVDEQVDMIATRARRLGVTLIVIETVSRVGAGETNDAASALITAGERIARDAGAGIVFVHHTGKDNAKNRAADAAAARGASAFTDNARATLILVRPKRRADETEDDPNALVLTTPKVNDAREPPVLALVRFGTPYGLTLRLRNPGRPSPEMDVADQLAIDVAAQRRADRNESIRAAVAMIEARGERVTRTSLRNDYREMIRPPIGYDDVMFAVNEAVAAGVIFEGPEKRGRAFILRAAPPRGSVGSVGSVESADPPDPPNPTIGGIGGMLRPTDQTPPISPPEGYEKTADGPPEFNPFD